MSGDEIQQLVIDVSVASETEKMPKPLAERVVAALRDYLRFASQTDRSPTPDELVQQMGAQFVGSMNQMREDFRNRAR